MVGPTVERIYYTTTDRPPDKLSAVEQISQEETLDSVDSTERGLLLWCNGSASEWEFGALRSDTGRSQESGVAMRDLVTPSLDITVDGSCCTARALVGRRGFVEGDRRCG